MYLHVFFKQKSDAFVNFASLVEKQTGRQIKVIRSDNGKEFVNSKFQQYCSEKGIIHQTTVVYSAQQNGVLERANSALVEMGRCFLNSSGLPQVLW